MIGIIDYGLGNLKSFSNILKRLDSEFLILQHNKDFDKCSKFILPGVGSFDEAINKLKSKDYFENLEFQIINKQKKILGICVGMQIFLDKSEEGSLKGLGWVSGEVKKFSNQNFRVPHIGWNKLKVQKKNELFKNLINPEFYFLHSYYCQLNNLDQSISLTNYSIEFCSSFVYRNIFGIQFHPEKSHENGIQLLNNFIKL